MDAVAAVRNRLLMVNAVTLLVPAARITTGQIPQSTELPAIAVVQVGSVQRSHLRGSESMVMTRVQVTSLAVSRAAVVAIDQAIYGNGAGTALVGWFGALGSPSLDVRYVQPAGDREEYEAGERRRYRIDRDVLVHHRR